MPSSSSTTVANMRWLGFVLFSITWILGIISMIVVDWKVRHAPSTTTSRRKSSLLPLILQLLSFGCIIQVTSILTLLSSTWGEDEEKEQEQQQQAEYVYEYDNDDPSPTASTIYPSSSSLSSLNATASFTSSIDTDNMAASNDGGGGGGSLHLRQLACIVTPWLFFVGQTMVLSSLVSYVFCIQHYGHDGKDSGYRRRSSSSRTIRGVILPLCLLLCMTLSVLVAWTIADPWMFREYVVTTTATSEDEYEHTSDNSLTVDSDIETTPNGTSPTSSSSSSSEVLVLLQLDGRCQCTTQRNFWLFFGLLMGFITFSELVVIAYYHCVLRGARHNRATIPRTENRTNNHDDDGASSSIPENEEEYSSSNIHCIELQYHPHQQQSAVEGFTASDEGNEEDDGDHSAYYSMCANLQTWLLGIPILVILEDYTSSTNVVYIGRIMLIWIFSMCPLCIVVIPQIIQVLKDPNGDDRQCPTSSSIVVSTTTDDVYSSSAVTKTTATISSSVSSSSPNTLSSSQHQQWISRGCGGSSSSNPSTPTRTPPPYVPTLSSSSSPRLPLSTISFAPTSSRRITMTGAVSTATSSSGRGLSRRDWSTDLPLSIIMERTTGSGGSSSSIRRTGSSTSNYNSSSDVENDFACESIRSEDDPIGIAFVLP